MPYWNHHSLTFLNKKDLMFLNCVYAVTSDIFFLEIQPIEPFFFFFLFPFSSLDWNRQWEGSLLLSLKFLEGPSSCAICLHMDREEIGETFLGEIEGGGLDVVWTSWIFKTRELWVLEILSYSYDTNSFDSFPFVSVTWEVIHKLVQNVPSSVWCEKQCRCKTSVTVTWRTLSFVV